jgi:hypothetical protein
MRAWLEARKVLARFSSGFWQVWRHFGVTAEALACMCNLTLPDYAIPSVHRANNTPVPLAPYSIPLRCGEANLEPVYLSRTGEGLITDAFYFDLRG